MLTTVKFAKVNPDAIIPSKRDGDAGYDVYPCFDKKYLIIKPHTTVMIPTGICSAFDSDYVFVLKERGSTGTKGIGQRSGVIDSSFRGEWMIPITNHNDKYMAIVKDEKEFKNVLESLPFSVVYPYNKAICQALLFPVPEVEIEEYTYEEIQEIPSFRGDGMLGSSGK